MAAAGNIDSESLREEDYADQEPDESADDEDVVTGDCKFTAVRAGRQLGTQVPRFDIPVMRPFEVLLADNKDYPCQQRGGAVTAFTRICIKTRDKFKEDVSKKAHNGKAFAKMVCKNGTHKLPYECTLHTGGCGTLEPVVQVAVQSGTDRICMPPREQSLSEAEKVCDKMWGAGRVLLLHSGQSPTLRTTAVSYAMYVDMRMATGPSRRWLTPFEMIYGYPTGVPPSVTSGHSTH
jgi:hypothetical protein